LVRCLGLEASPVKNLEWSARKPCDKNSIPVLKEPYVIVHPGAGLEFKAWPTAHWKKLVYELAARGQFLVFTGRGASEMKIIEQLMKNVPNSLNLCDRLNWPQFLQVIEEASLLVGIDSLAGHLAAVLHTPSVGIYSGRTNLKQFSPLSERATTLTHPVPCAPCFLSRGCEGMECVRNVEVDTVLQACLRSLSPEKY
jgi:ADP-heptose:LPS heptosyltransferase